MTNSNSPATRMHPDEAMGDYVTLTSGPASQTTSPRTIDWFSAVVPAAEPDQPPTPAYTCPVCGSPQPIAGATCGACLARLAEYDRAAAEGRLVLLPMAVGTEVFAITSMGVGFDHIEYYEVWKRGAQWFGTEGGDLLAMDDEGKTWWRTDEEAEAEVERRRGQ